jgi:peptidoglycan/LPS O-acetylase OafA/YrhL
MDWISASLAMRIAGGNSFSLSGLVALNRGPLLPCGADLDEAARQLCDSNRRSAVVPTFILWPFIRDVYIAEPTYLISAAAFLWAWLAGWLAYSHRGNRPVVFYFMVGGFLGIWTQAKFFGIVDLTSGAANLLAWAATLAIVFFRIGVPAGDKVGTTLNYLGDISFPLYLLHYPVLFALTSSVFKIHPEWNYGIVQVIIALVFAALAYHFVDRPLRSGIRRTGRRQPDHLSLNIGRGPEPASQSSKGNVA